MDLKQTHEVIQWRKDLPGLSDPRQLPEGGRAGGWQDGRSWAAVVRGRARPGAESVGRVGEVRAERGQGREPSFLSRSHRNL